MPKQPIQQSTPTLDDLEAVGVVETFTPDEAARMGAFDEDAVSLADAIEATRTATGHEHE